MNPTSVPCGVLTANDALQIVEVNDFMTDVLGWSREELVGMTMPDILGRAGTIFLNTHINPSLAVHGRVDEVYLDLRTRDGDSVPVLVNGQRIAVDGGAFNVMAFMPMHRRRLFEHELISARDAAIESARAERDAHEQMLVAQARLVGRERLASLGTLAHGVAHEINNPLVILRLSLEQLREDVQATGVTNADSLLELVAGALEGAERIADITRQLGTMVRAEEMPLTALDVRQVAEWVARMTKPAALGRAHVTLSLEGPALVEADSGRLGQVLINLVINAVQAFNGRAEAENEICIATRVEGEDTVIVEVRDNGSGIPADVLEHIFEPFFTTKPVGEGTGLGLSISKSLMESLGGTLTCHTELGVGTTFRISMPRLSPA